MTYKLYFHPNALKEWKKLSKGLQGQFKKILRRRLDQPHMLQAKLSGKIKNCYKIKLRQAGYRLVYQVNDKGLIVVVIAVGRRDGDRVYHLAATRMKDV